MLVPLMKATFIRRCTRCAARETTRKIAPGLLLVALLAAGCATPGPLHVYFAGAPAPETITDLGGEKTVDVPSFLEPEDRLTGLAYDPFTDHLFLRLAPGNKLRVVDRPARAIKREFAIEGLSAAGGGDLAVRPRDGHIFLLEERGACVAETTRIGKLLRTFSLEGAGGPLVGLAYDSAANRLLALHADGRRITSHEPDGKRVGELALSEAVGPSLAVDGERREILAPLAAGAGAIGVFDFSGKPVRTLPHGARFVDVGPRSFVRVF